MNNGDDDPRVYQALALPEQALEDGGLEILRAGLVKDELYVTALPAFKAAAQWGEVLAEIANRIGAIYAAQTPGLSKKDVTVEIAQAFATEIGARPVAAKPRAMKKPAKKAAKNTAKPPVKKAARKKR